MIRFTKMQGIGNDYVYIDTITGQIDSLPELAVRVSERHFGVGSDGLIVIGLSELADFKMDMYNADGSRAEMCGNGIRCAAKYVYDKGFTDKLNLSFETLAGIKHIVLHRENGAVSSVTVDMGEPRLEPENIPVITDSGTPAEVVLSADGNTYSALCVSMGNPHAVIFCGDPDDIDLHSIGTHLENAPVFPKRVNTEFVSVLSHTLLKMRVWERGSGETMACGTGACAAVVAAVIKGLCERKVTVELKGGSLLIEWNESDGRVYMTGPAQTVFDGTLY